MLLDLLLTKNEKALNKVKGRLGYHNRGTRVSGPERYKQETQQNYWTLGEQTFRNLFGTNPREFVLKRNRLGNLFDFSRRTSSKHKD